MKIIVRNISTYIQLLKSVIYIGRFLKRQKGYNDAYVKNFLEPHYNYYNRKLNPGTQRKIFSYYVPAIPLFVHGISILQRGSGLSVTETQKSILMGILTPVYDDLLDLNQIAIEHQKQVFLHPESYTPTILEDAIVKEVLLKINELGVFEPDKYQRSKENVYQSQIDSLKQLIGTTTYEELFQITDFKSQSAQILFACVIDAPIDERVEHSIKLFATLGQLTNDCCDVYEDYHEGIRTIANTCEDFEILEAKYIEDTRAFCNYTRLIGFEKKRTELYLNIMVVMLSVGIVMIRQLVELQKKIGKGPLPFDKLPRKAFIGDMETIPNMLRIFKTAIDILRK